jgi:hypothetical protein
VVNVAVSTDAFLPHRMPYKAVRHTTRSYATSVHVHGVTTCFLEAMHAIERENFQCCKNWNGISGCGTSEVTNFFIMY